MARTIVIAFCGLPGSGKSTLALALQECTGWRRLDRDMLRGELFSAGGYSRDDKRRLADVMRERLQAMLQAEESVILDGMTFSREAERDAFSRLAALYAAHWLLVWMDCGISTAKQRIAEDVLHPAADRNAALVDEVAARFETPLDAVRLDCAWPVSQQLQALLKEIERHDQEV